MTILIFGQANPLDNHNSRDCRWFGIVCVFVCENLRVCNLHGFRPGDVFDPLR